MNSERTATWIKVAAVAVAAPRWVGALLEAEGVPLPVEWKTWWVIVSAVCAAGMALVEAGAFAYCFSAWRQMRDRQANVMAVLIIASAVIFVGVLTPYLMSNVAHVTMASILQGGWLAAWSICVAASTILIVSSVGFAQKKPSATGKRDTATDTPLAKSDAPKMTRDQFVTVWQNNKNNGNHTVKEMAEQIGIPERTVYRWVASIEDKAQ